MMHAGLDFLKTLNRPALIGMVHVGALPGTPRAEKSIKQLCDDAIADAQALADNGADAIAIENMHDLPYLNRRVGPEIVAAMTAVCDSVRSVVSLPIGVQILAGANRAALAVAHATNCQFIRAEGFVFAAVADEGLLGVADAGPLLRFQRKIGAEHIAILADIKKKHSSHAITSDISIVETAEAAVFSGADGVIVTGSATGAPTDAAEVAAVRKAVNIPVLVGSGTTPENLATIGAQAHAFIVGSYLKRDGHWYNPVDAARVAIMAKAIAAIRKPAT